MSEPTPPKTGGLWARLFSMTSDADEKKKDVQLHPAVVGNGADAIPLAKPVETPVAIPIVMPVEAAAPLAMPVPVAMPVHADESHFSGSELEAANPVVEEVSFLDVEDISDVPTQIPLADPAEPLAGQTCESCGAPRKPKLTYCDDCGWMFPPGGVASGRAALSGVTASPAGFPPAISASSDPQTPRAATMPTANMRVKDRYQIMELMGDREGVSRYRGLDHGHGGQPAPVVIVRAPQALVAEPILEDIPVAILDDEEIMPGFDDPMPVATPIERDTVVGGTTWPSLAWEKELLEQSRHPSLPVVVDFFAENNFDYLIEELPQGRSLWDAWDEPEADANVRYGWLQQIAQATQALHNAGGMLEGIRPDLIVVSSKGQAVIADLSDLLPLPLPSNPSIRATLYTAPELILNPQTADARSTLYSFGAMLYSLEYLHHALEEKDFEHQFAPKQITDRYPDVHPLFFRLLNKTFVRDPNMRFPTDEAVKTDPSGMTEFIRALETCRRCFDNVRLDIAAWTTTGMVRTGNEDAFAVLHGVEARQDDLWEYAMVLLCDGMGGYEAGEVAAALTIYEMRKFLLNQPLFASLSGKEPPGGPVNNKTYQDVLMAALRHANKEVYTAARVPGKGRRGMGCTAECVYVDSGNVVVGHVGDSRTYHLQQGRLIQLTRDQTLVNRLVELGQLTAEEAEHHPRKNELQQAIGGQPDVTPNVYSAKLKRGDWVLVCSDGLTNHIPTADLEKMLTREAAYSAEEAARRLLNLVNLRGATDNATIVVIRAS